MKTATQKWEKQMQPMLRQARQAAVCAGQLSSEVKKKILCETAAELVKKEAVILSENKKDLRHAKAAGLSAPLVDRLTLTARRIREMAEGVRTVAGLKDPIGKVEARWRRPNGLRLSRVRVPLGLILIIYEARPNVTAECASLCLKSGNAVILRGGREAFYSNRALAAIFEKSLERHRVPKACVNFVKTTDHAAVDYLLTQSEFIQLVIPRGGEALIRKVVAQSKIPVVKHYRGICHVYVDRKANLHKAVAIVCNAKLQRPATCNAAETLLVHRGIAAAFLPLLGERLRAAGCEVRGDKVTKQCLPWAKGARANDYGREFLDKILAVKIVPDIDAAIRHIGTYGSAHTDAIVTEDVRAADLFKKRVDSSSVMVNASTRFSDGFQYGFGAEIGISTDKIHARGPMGLEGLTSYKYVVEGAGHIRE